MGKINWGRVVLCGLLTFSVSLLLGLVVFVFALGETEFVRAVETARPTLPWLPMILHPAGGIWVMWLYAAIRPRYGPGPKTAAIAGVALWIIGAVINFLWVSMGLLPFSPGALLVPAAVGLPITIVGAVVGAWQYKE
jgi:hypothetical protein